MKHILVGVDFSKSADRALAYAEEIALKFSAQISIVHIHESAGDSTDEIEMDRKSSLTVEAQLAKLAASVAERGITTEASSHLGKVVPTLRKIILEGDCDLVVLGCQGEHFLPNNPWGSTTTSLMEDTRIPILAVPSYAPVKYPRRFILATDKECLKSLRQLSPLLTLLETDRTRLLLFHYQQSTERAAPDRQYAKLLEGHDYRFYYQVDNHQPIGDAISDFAFLTAADLVVVTHREDHWLTSKTDSVARRVSWTATVPVLILQDSY
jgi:nucleotide-binding universal stress UspA family protein